MILIWIVAAVFLIVGMRHTKWGRNLYAVGGKRLSAERQVLQKHEQCMMIKPRVKLSAGM